MSMNRLRRPALLALAGALTIGALGCADDADPERADTESISSTSEDARTSGTTSADDGADDEAETSSGESGSGASGGEVLGTASAQLPFSLSETQLVPLRADVTRLERNGDLVELTITLTNESEPSAGLSYEAWRQFEDISGGNYDISAVGLVDGAGQKIYLPARDVEGICLCTDGLADTAVPPGESLLLNATIGGVPDDVEQVDVAIPGFPTIVGLTIR